MRGTREVAVRSAEWDTPSGIWQHLTCRSDRIRERSLPSLMTLQAPDVPASDASEQQRTARRSFTWRKSGVRNRSSPTRESREKLLQLKWLSHHAPNCKVVFRNPVC